MNTNLPIILGSSSQWRQKVMAELGIPFTIMTADIDEKAVRHEDPEKMVVLIAKAKATALLPKITEPSILITADQVVRCNGEIREKPVDTKQAWKFLASYNRYPLETISAVVVTNTATGKTASGVEIAKLIYKKAPLLVFGRLIDKGDVFKAAGAYIHEDEMIKPYVNYLQGTPDSFNGLPLGLMEKLVAQVS